MASVNYDICQNTPDSQQASRCPDYSSTSCEFDHDVEEGPSSEVDPRTSVYFTLSVYSNQTGSPVITLSPSMEWDKEAVKISDVEAQIDNTIRWIESYTHDSSFIEAATPPPGQYAFANGSIASATPSAADEADETNSQECTNGATSPLATYRHTCENFQGMASPTAEPTHGDANVHDSKPPTRKPSKLSKKRPSLSSQFVPKRASRLLELNPLKWLVRSREKG